MPAPADPTPPVVPGTPSDLPGGSEGAAELATERSTLLAPGGGMTGGKTR
jgi:hypothetical protein